LIGEAAVIAAIGGLLGMGAAALLCTGVRQAPTGIIALKTLEISPAIAIYTLLIALSIGVVSSLIPASSASRTSILDSLRYSG
jgi:putative ABC transport system permease protein